MHMESLYMWNIYRKKGKKNILKYINFKNYRRIVIPYFEKRDVMSITFSQQIISSELLLVVIGGQKSNLSYKFKLEPIITYYLWFVMKILWI